MVIRRLERRAWDGWDGGDDRHSWWWAHCINFIKLFTATSVYLSRSSTHAHKIHSKCTANLKRSHMHMHNVRTSCWGDKPVLPSQRSLQ